MDCKDLEKLIKICRKEGVLSLKTGAIELTLSHDALFPESPYKKKKRETQPELTSEHIPVDNQFSEEDALFWSSAGIPPEAN